MHAGGQAKDRAIPLRRLAVGLTPMETRRDVVLHLADRAEELGHEAFFLAEGWGHDAGVLLAEVETRTSRITLGTGIVNIWVGLRPASRCWPPALPRCRAAASCSDSVRASRPWQKACTTSSSGRPSSSSVKWHGRCAG